MPILEILLFTVTIIMSLGAICYVSAFFFGAPYVPTPASVITEVIKYSKLTKDDVVYDLGSGDGRMLIASAKRGAQSLGWEINPFLVVWTKIMAQKNGVGREVSVSYRNYKSADMSSATVVFLYNLPAFLPYLEKKFHKELQKGTIIISYKFPLNTFKPTKQTESGIFFYKKS